MDSFWKGFSCFHKLSLAHRCRTAIQEESISPLEGSVNGLWLNGRIWAYWLTAIADGWLPAAYGEPLTADNAPLPVLIANTETSSEVALAT